ncbi:MAG TPA: ATP-binding cassette domain-containing protein [Rhizomicrobium sp.]|nr:ATP-binding cassette domain-containing protein [Rhizomicrobium sp.]
MMESGPLVEISDLTVSRGGTPALDRFSLRLEAGESAIVLGENGCGKEALLRVLGGFADNHDAVSGVLRLRGTEVKLSGRRARSPLRIAWLPNPLTQPFAPHAGVLSQLVRVVARKLGSPMGSAREELRLALERLSTPVTPELLDAKPSHLDPVTQAIGLLAAVSAQTPELVLADHAMADLGPSAVKMLLEMLAAEQKRIGFSLIYATGGLQPPARLGGRVIVLRQGRVVEEGDATRLMSGHAHAYTRTLFKALPQLSLTEPRPRTSARGQPLLQVYGLSYDPEAHPRDGVTFELRRGAALALIGEEGSGRRALLRAILAFEHAASGRVVFDAVDLNILSQAMASRIRRRIAFITGTDESLDPRMTLWDTVDEPLRAHLDLSGDLVAGYREAALKRVGLASHDGKRLVGSLSAFDKRRLQVARAFVSAPLLTVIDEPLRGLDAFARTILREVLMDFRVTQGPAFLVITSDFTVAQALAEDAMIFHEGKLIERGPIVEILRNPQEDATKALIEAVTLPDLSREPSSV